MYLKKPNQSNKNKKQRRNKQNKERKTNKNQFPIFLYDIHHGPTIHRYFQLKNKSQVSFPSA